MNAEAGPAMSPEKRRIESRGYSFGPGSKSQGGDYAAVPEQEAKYSGGN